MSGFLIGLVAVIAVFIGIYLLAPKGWRTRLSSWAVVAAGAVDSLGQMLNDSNLAFLGSKTAGAIMLAVGIIMWFLREVTTTAPGKKA